MKAFNVELLIYSQFQTVMTTNYALSSLTDKLFHDACISVPSAYIMKCAYFDSCVMSVVKIKK